MNAFRKRAPAEATPPPAPRPSTASALHTRFARQPWLRFALLVLAGAIFILLAWRQHRFVDHYAVNMMFWDQWDFYQPIFKHEGLWAVFSYQHGPHRQGIGFLVTDVLAGLGHWNSRWDAFGVSFTLMLAAVAGCALALRCGCRAWLALPVTALLFFNLRQYEGFAGPANLSHGAVPVLLLMLYGLACFIRSAPVRLLTLGLLTFLLIFTGFGIFAGLFSPVLFIIEAVHAFRKPDRRHGWLALGALGLSLASWCLFARHYVFSPAVENFQFPHPRPWEYFYFIGVMFSNFYGLTYPVALAIIVGLGIAAGVAALGLRHGWRLLRHGPESRAVDVVICFLAVFALLFCLNTAIGRISLGFTGAARGSRYVTLLIPAGLALYIGLTRLIPQRAAAIGLLNILILSAGTLMLHPRDWKTIHWFHDGRAAWKAAYLETHDELLANQRSGFPVYPNPGNIVQRLNYLEQHQLNLFAPAPPVPLVPPATPP